MDTKKLIENFISRIICKYPSLKIGYDYDDNLDEYDIWHTDQNLEFNDKDFKAYVAKMAKDYLFKNNIYNFSFGYDHYKYKDLKSAPRFEMTPEDNEIVLKINKNPLILEREYTFNYCTNMDANNQNPISHKKSTKTPLNSYKSPIDSKIDGNNMFFADNVFEVAV